MSETINRFVIQGRDETRFQKLLNKLSNMTGNVPDYAWIVGSCDHPQCDEYHLAVEKWMDEFCDTVEELEDLTCKNREGSTYTSDKRSKEVE